MSATLDIHGFRVLPIGRVSREFNQALRRIAARGYTDPSCVIIKTNAGPDSGITHAGGRYLHAANPYTQTVMAIMRDKGIAPPPPPFLVAPGATTLFHEWGHHVDHLWSGHDNIVHFSVRWFSHFYEVRRRALAGRASRRQMQPGRTIKTEADAVDVVVEWRRFASELFAMLFEDWMRGAKRFSVDSCDPQNLLSREAIFMKLAFLSSVSSDDVRHKTYALFEAAHASSAELPEMRDGFLGHHTFAVLDSLRRATDRIRAETVSADGTSP